MIGHHIQAFKEEAYDLLAELETSLLALEEKSDDTEIIGRVFRAMHTIKGSGAMFGFDEIARFTHEVETVFDLVRNGVLVVTDELINLSLASRDHIKGMLDASGGGVPVDHEVTEKIVTSLQKLIPKSEKPARTAVGLPSPPMEAEETVRNTVTYRIRFKPDKEIFMSGTNPVSLIRELSEMGRCKVVAQTARIPFLQEFQPDHCYVFWDIILTTDRGRDAIEDVFIFVADDCELTIDTIECSDDNGEEEYKKLGEILVEKGELSDTEMARILAMQQRFGDLAVAIGAVSPDGVQAALVEQQHIKEVRQDRQSQETASSIRVPADKLDMLVNLVGELVTVQARLTQTALSRADADLVAIAEEVERLSADLRDNALNIRMLPIGSTFSKFKRLVRDLAGELGKEIDMTTEGAETELDKTVIERLGDPLVHIIRNSIDHGIEYPGDREAAGKSRRGTIRLAAVHSGSSVLISIVDDGAGLDKEAIRAKAVERGLIQPGAELTENEIFALIFAPGFSTAKAVTNVSGRGVGMDVVKRAIDTMRGTIELTSKKGEGTTLTISIPLTLAIIESLLVQIKEDRFVIPLSIVNECVELTRQDVEASHGRNLATVRGHLVPYVPLRERFGIAGDPPLVQQIVITEINGSKVGFVVDQVIGEHQAVIKSLGKTYRNARGVSGATILGDGSVALILDTPNLVMEYESEIYT